MDTSTSGHIGRVRVKNHMSRQLLDWQHTMHNVKITPVNSGYQLKFSQFSSDVYPDTSCTETIIAASMTKRKKLSIFSMVMFKSLESSGSCAQLFHASS